MGKRLARIWHLFWHHSHSAGPFPSCSKIHKHSIHRFNAEESQYIFKLVRENAKLRAERDRLLSVAEAARDHREGVYVEDGSSTCPHCGADDCWSDPEDTHMPLRCTTTGRAVWVREWDADEYLAIILARLDAENEL